MGPTVSALPFPAFGTPVVLLDEDRLPYEAQQWAVKGLIPRKGLGSIYGPSKSGKQQRQCGNEEAKLHSASSSLMSLTKSSASCPNGIIARSLPSRSIRKIEEVWSMA